MKRWHITIALAVLAAGAAWLAERARVDVPVLIGVLPSAEDERRAALNKKLQMAWLDEILTTDPRISACFADALSHLGHVPDVIVRMHLLPNGTVDDVVVADPAQLAGSGLAMCLTTTIETMGFPIPDGGTPVWVSYRFEGS